MEKKYQVFISSTFQDLQEERKKVQEAILDMDCIPACMESFPAGNIDQFEYIKKVIDLSDYVVILSGNSYGSIAEDGMGYTEKEFRYAKKKGIPIIVFLLSNYIGEANQEKRILLDEFRKSLETGRIVKYWNNPDDLKSKAIAGLYNVFTSTPRDGWVRGGPNDIYTAKVYFSKEEPKGVAVGSQWLQPYD